jgi:hypothetical protein
LAWRFGDEDPGSELLGPSDRFYPGHVRTPVPGELRQFATLQPDVEAVIQRCGLDTYDLLLIDLDGNWTRWVFPSQEAAASVAADLDVPVHDGWDDDRLTRRMAKNDPWNEPGGRRRAL